MSCKFNLFGKSFVALGALMVVCAAYAAGRDGGESSARGMQMGTLGAGAPAAGREGRDVRNIEVVRMPAMPQLPINSVGNLSPNVGQKPTVPSVPNVPVVPDTPNEPDVPETPDEPEVPDTPVEPECPDGGVKNSEYTVNMCMNDIRTCVNNGGLTNGLADLYNANMMASVINGVGVCVNQVEKCVREVRRDCKNVYNSNSEVWIDFESRVVQPEYYNFVLRKTGLTPYQAQMTCEMLDKVAYGPSFSAVDGGQNVTGEYAQNVGAFNDQMDGTLEKIGTLDNLEPGRVDELRGHYARWDAMTAECLVRVAAYHKDELITNRWLGLGDDSSAEAWVPAGETFTCGKDLFGFALRNQTKAAAVLAPTAGALVGGAIGAGVGATTSKEMDCSEGSKQWKEAKKLIDDSGYSAEKGYMYDACKKLYSTATEVTCACFNRMYKDVIVLTSGECSINETKNVKNISFDNGELFVDGKKVQNITNISCSGEAQPLRNSDYIQNIVKAGTRIQNIMNEVKHGANIGKGVGIGAGAGAGVGGLVTAITALVEGKNISCRVGDGLATVELNKSDKVNTLKEFYVKWGLNLPEAIRPNEVVTDCLSWQAACAGINDYSQCKAAQINYQPDGAPNITQVRAACTVSGNACIHNPPVAKSYGACE